MTNAAQTYLKYANLQMAAEAFLADGKIGNDLKNALEVGNKHSSVFPSTLATEFASEWEVVKHQKNTSTGFSGTLFKHRLTNEYVLSFRSTEFIDDQVRDSEVTNKGIKESGWAFGQISDMWDWWQNEVDPALNGAQVAVTGYSLGGHLAYAFHRMLAENGEAGRIAAMYTFNGAGTGEIVRGRLNDIVDAFKTTWKGSAQNGGGFYDPAVRALYLDLLARPAGALSRADAANAIALVQSPYNDSAEARLLADAVGRVLKVQDSVDYVAGIAGADKVPGAEIAATNVAYWVGVLRAQTQTRSVNTGVSDLISGAYTRSHGQSLSGVAGGVFDIYGYETANSFGNPSAVANSQLHFGADAPVYIESQPLTRGSYVFDAAVASAQYSSIKLLSPDFEHNDFGDTHSLVLLVDSLAVQDVLYRLAVRQNSQVTLADLQKLLSYATANKATAVPPSQGEAEGDTLETVVDALSLALLGADPELRKAPNLNDGNTWHDTTGSAPLARREQLHSQLNSLRNYIEASSGVKLLSLAGGQAGDLVELASADDAQGLAYRYALAALNPFVLLGVDYAPHNQNGELSLHDSVAGAGGLTAQWIESRAAMLAVLLQGNEENKDIILQPQRDLADGKQIRHFVDNALDKTIAVSPVAATTQTPPPSSYTIFAGDGGEQLTGAATSVVALNDYLFGGAGDDTLLGLRGDDYLEGGAGSDRLVGDDGSDTLIGGAGNDSLSGGDGVDQLAGGAGDDTLDGGDGYDFYQISEGGGADVIVDSDRNGTLVFDGTLGRYTLALTFRETTPGQWEATLPDTRKATLTGGNSQPWVLQLPGGGTVNLGTGFKSGEFGLTLLGGGGEVEAIGTPSVGVRQMDLWGFASHGDDWIQMVWKRPVPDCPIDLIESASAGFKQFMEGNDRYDDFIEYDVRSEVHAGQGSDTVFGYGGMDLIYGDGGDVNEAPGLTNDLLVGGNGHDLIHGGPGDDTVFGAEFYTSAQIDAVDAAEVGVSDPGDWISGGDGDDVVVGGSGSDLMTGGAQSDCLWGGGGNDLILADIDHYGGWQRRHFRDGNGHSVHYFDFEIGFSGGYGYQSNFRYSLNVNIVYTDGYVDVQTNSDINTSLGIVIRDIDGGKDSLHGGLGSDTLFGGYNDDFLDGGGDDDQLFGEPGADTLIGGDGGDTLVGDEFDDGVVVPVLSSGLHHGKDVLLGGAGDDHLFGNGESDSLVGGDGDDVLEGDDNVTPGTYHGEDTLIGGLGADSLWGGGEADWMEGGDGDDYIEGDGVDLGDEFHGADTLLGGRGNDTLYGQASADWLDGGAGADFLSGGSGDDRYVFALGDARLVDGEADTIEDSDGIDTVVFKGRSGFEGVVSTALSGDLHINLGNGEELFINGGMTGAVDRFEDGFGRTLSLAGFLNTTLQSARTLAASGDGASLAGSAVGDTLQSSFGSTVFMGGYGNDSIVASRGGNTFRFELGDGVDTVSASGGQVDAGGQLLANRLVLGAGISEDMLKVTVVKDGWINRAAIDFGVAGRIVLPNVNLADVLASPTFDEIEFESSGAVRTWSEVFSGGFDIVASAPGGENLSGSNLDDRFTSGSGNDYFYGGAGSDEYRVGRGRGDDIISDVSQQTAAGSDIDTIRFGFDVSPANVRVSRSGVGYSDLTLSFGGSGESVTLQGFFSNDAVVSTRWRFVFDDQTEWDVAEVVQRAMAGTDSQDGIVGLAGDDVLIGLAGNDYLSGRGGNDSLDGGAGSDNLVGDNGDDLLDGGADGDNLSGGGGNDTLIGNAGNDWLDGGAGDDEYRFGFGDGQDTLNEYDTAPGKIGILRLSDDVLPENVDLFRADNGLTLILKDADGDSTGDWIHLKNYFSSAGSVGRIDRIEFRNGTVWTYEDIKPRLLAATQGDDVLAGFAEGDAVSGLGGNDVISGEAGDDTLTGGDGNDWIGGGVGADQLFGDDGADTLWGYDRVNLNETGNDVLSGERGDDLLYGGKGSDVYLFERGDGDDTIGDVLDAAGNDMDVLRLGAGIHPEDVSFYRGYTPFGGPPVDDLIIRISGGADQITVNDFFGSSNESIERIEFDGGNGATWGRAEILSWGIESGAVDSQTGTSGDDVFFVDHEADVIIEAIAGGHDRVDSTRSYRLPENVEDLTLLGDLNSDAQGNALNNLLVGNSGNNRLIGFEGFDTGAGGAGDDIYIGIGQVIEQQNGGVDTWIRGRVQGFSPLSDNVENLSLEIPVGSGFGSSYGPNWSVTAYGNDLDNALWSSGLGFSGDVLDGLSGADTMIALGFDSVVFHVDNVGDVVIASATGGSGDKVISAVDFELPDNVESLELSGSLGLRGSGNGLDNTLKGSAGGDTLLGGGGRDVLLGDSAGTSTSVAVDSLTVFARGREAVGVAPTMEVWIDGVLVDTFAVSSSDYQPYSVALSPGLQASQIDVVFANDYRDPTAGEDRNLYIEKIVVGSREILASAPGVLYDIGRGSDAFDGLNLYSAWGGMSTNGSLRFGLAGNDSLDGGSGADTMRGGIGNDVYRVDDMGDVIDELAGAGHDQVKAVVSYSLPQYVEDLQLLGTADINATGNSEKNDLLGNAGANRLDGAEGADFMAGYDGDDTYVVDNVGDMLWENAGQGYDTVQSSISYRLKDHFEDLTLIGTEALNGTGNGADNRITGNMAGNVLKGEAGNDFLIGDDADASGTLPMQSLVVYARGKSAAGVAPTMEVWIDGVMTQTFNVASSSFQPFEVTFPAGTEASQVDVLFTNDYWDPAAGEDRNLYIEKIVVDGREIANTDPSVLVDWGTGAAAFDGLKLSAWPWLNSNGAMRFSLLGNDVLDGGSGSDTLQGGIGRDTLLGGDGDDLLIGGIGSDSLSGGSGNDIYFLGRGDGRDKIDNYDIGAGRIDALDFDSGISSEQLWFRHVGNDLEISIIGTMDSASIVDWYVDDDYRLNEFKTAEGGTLLAGQVDNLVSAMAAFAPPAAGQTTLPQNYQEALSGVIAANWQ